MNIFIGLFIILGFLATGNLLSALLGEFMPGSVMGMLLLFLSLLAGIVKDKWIRPVATFLTDNMMIFFMPAFMGIMDLWGVVKMDLWSWVAVMVVSTVLVMLSAGLTQTLAERLTLRKDGTPSRNASKDTTSDSFNGRE